MRSMSKNIYTLLHLHKWELEATLIAVNQVSKIQNNFFSRNVILSVQIQTFIQFFYQEIAF